METIKSWVDRMPYPPGTGESRCGYMQAEIDELRAVLSNQQPAAAPVSAPSVDRRRAMFQAYSECLTSTDMLPQDIAGKLLAAAAPAIQQEGAALDGLAKLPWTDQSTADPITKAKRVLDGIATCSISYFYNDGYPRSDIATDAKNVLALIESLAAPAPVQPAPVADAVVQGELIAELKRRRASMYSSGLAGLSDIEFLERLERALNKQEPTA